ncbi:MAG: TIGR04282 family arsenosugar biosynthesis glycosyltransferase [Pirellulales bacterium]
MIQLGVFAKYWQPGEVKTRLAKSIGATEAANLYRAFLECLLARFGDFGHDRVLNFTPCHQRQAFSNMLPAGWRLAEQGDGDLGQRMRRYFEQFHAETVTADSTAILIGSDAPTLPHQRLRRAAVELESTAVVLGPSDDGGYYLIGLRRDALSPELLGGLFDEMPWSEPALLMETVERLKHHCVGFSLLEPWYDVDDYDALVKLRQELRAELHEEPAFRQLGRMVDALFDE